MHFRLLNNLFIIFNETPFGHIILFYTKNEFLLNSPDNRTGNNFYNFYNFCIRVARNCMPTLIHFFLIIIMIITMNNLM